MRAKRELIRLVRTPAGEIRVDTTGKVSGRGAYVCPSIECADVAVRERRLEHALETPLPDAVASELRAVAGRGTQLSGKA
jgi:predicted RNA-binding protein YlxR (DUF448 family)